MKKLACLIVLLFCIPLAMGPGAIGPTGQPQAPILLHKANTGVTIGYYGAANTDAARGAALRSVLTAVATGDRIELGPGSYDIGSTVPTQCPTNLTIQGSGWGSSVITSQVDVSHGTILANSGLRIINCSVLNTVGPAITNLTGGTIDDVLIQGCYVNGTWDTFNSSTQAVTNAKFYNCYLWGLFDGMFWKNSSAEFNNCDIYMNSNGVHRVASFILDTSSFIVRSCRVRTTQNTAGAVTIAAWMKAGACSFKCWNTEFITTQTANTGTNSSDIYSYLGNGSSTAEFHGCTFSTTSGGSENLWDISASGDTVLVDAATKYSSAKIDAEPTKYLFDKTPSSTFLSNAISGVTYPASGTLLVSGGALGTPSSGVGTNLTALTAANITAGALANGMTATTPALYIDTTALQTAAGANLFQLFPQAQGLASTFGNNQRPGASDTYVAGRMGFVPYYVPISFTSLTITFTVRTAAASGKKAKVVRWSRSTLGKANSKLAESTEVVVDTTGDKSVTDSTAGGPGWYWFGLVCEANTDVHSHLTYSSSLGSILSSSTDYALRAYADYTYGSIPSTAGTLTSDQTQYNCPILKILPNP